MKLLTDTNPKLLKGIPFGYLPFILHLAPYTLSGHNVCPASSPECRKLCLNTAGRGRFDRTQNARIRKTKYLFEYRHLFLWDLIRDIYSGIRKARKSELIPCFRLNGTSDIRWEVLFPTLFEDFGYVRFYDYTKLKNRRNLPKNYTLTYSYSENDTEQDVHDIISHMNIAVVFSTKKKDNLPKEFMGYPVCDGDIHDLRFLDPEGSIVGLRAKGLAKGSDSPFVINVG
jgi:hypothetical protein